MPPTTPPAMAPVWEDDAPDEDDGDDVELDEGLPLLVAKLSAAKTDFRPALSNVGFRGLRLEISSCFRHLTGLQTYLLA